MKRILILYIILFLSTLLIPLISTTGKSASTSEMVTLFNGLISIL